MNVISSTKPQAWTLSPQMTEAPNLWRGCVFMLPMWLGSGDGTTAGNGPQSTFDLVSARQCTSQYSNSYAWGQGENGPFIRHPTGAVFGHVLATTGYHPVLGSKNRTCLVVHERLSNFGQGYHVLMEWGTRGVGARWTFRYQGNNLRYEVENAGYQTNLVVPINEVSVSAVVLNGDTFGDIFAYLNGKTDSTNSTLDINTAANKSLEIAGRGFFNEAPPDDRIYMCAIWDRALTVAELDSIYADPFAMLRPAGF